MVKLFQAAGWLAALWWLAGPAAAQAPAPPVKLEVQLMNSETLGEVVLDQSPFLDYVKRFNDTLTVVAATLPAGHDLWATQTLHPDRAPTVVAVARPAVAASLLARAQARLAAVAAPRSRFLPYSLLWKAAVGGGAPDQQAAFTPALQLPIYRAQAEFAALDLAGQYRAIRQWAATGALPVLATFEAKTEERFAGVRNVGLLLQRTNLAGPLDVAALTDQNNDYWRGCLEMGRGNQLLPMTKALLYAANGELDRAQLYLQLLEPVSDPKAVATQVAEDLHWQLEAFNKSLAASIQQGIALHDKGKFDQAIAHYNQLLATYPNSAWANHEKNLSASMGGLRKGGADTLNARRAAAAVFRCNPMYPLTAHASSGREGYELLLRMRLPELFKQKGKFEADYVEYADTALRLGEYGLAAQLDWIIFSLFNDPKLGGDERLADFLYCLDKLGNQQIRENFKGDFTKKFADIAARLDRDMKQSATYKAFKN